jgi:hypothetical protein
MQVSWNRYNPESLKSFEYVLFCFDKEISEFRRLVESGRSGDDLARKAATIADVAKLIVERTH